MRRTTEQVLAEFHRLFDVYEALSECWDRELPSPYAKYRASREQMLAALSNGATASQLLAGTREALNDRSEQLNDLVQDRPATAYAILTGYREKHGRDLWDDIGDPKKLLKRIMKRQRIVDETEYRLLSAYVGNQAQDLLTPDEIKMANSMLAQFEDTLR